MGRRLPASGLSHSVRIDIRPEFGWRVLEHSDVQMWFAGHLYSPACEGEEAARQVARVVEDAGSDDVVRSRLEKLDGQFAFVLVSRKRVLAVVDRVRSRPLFYSYHRNKLIISTQALRLCSELDCDEDQLNLDCALCLAMSGYVLGRDTLYGPVKQLRAGEALLFDRSANQPIITRYYLYRPLPLQGEDPAGLRKALAELILRVFEKLVASVRGRTILVPLSGGLDSRLIASGLAELGHRNVVCYAYGQPGNYEAHTSRLVAERLGFRWFFVPITHRLMAEQYRSVEHASYIEFADSCSSVPVEHEYASTKLLASLGYIPDSVVIVNGQSGDFLTGGHIPEELSSSNERRSVEGRREVIFSAAVAKHFSLWESLKTGDNLKRLASLFWDDLNAVTPLWGEDGLDYGLYECSEWQNRQSKYVVSGQRVYEFFGYDWRLPLWQNDFLDYWAAAPLKEKIGQRLYREMLLAENWGGVWRDLPVRRYPSPRWLRVVRPLAKYVVGLGGQSMWHRLDHRWLAYWYDIQGKIAVAPYNRVIRDKRGWRNSISWLTEAYLQRHGLDYGGRPLPRV